MNNNRMDLPKKLLKSKYILPVSTVALFVSLYCYRACSKSSNPFTSTYHRLQQEIQSKVVWAQNIIAT